jgi:hypothetical protein
MWRLSGITLSMLLTKYTEATEKRLMCGGDESASGFPSYL